MRDIGAPLSSFKSLKEVAELTAADGKQRPSKSGMQTCHGLPANLACVILPAFMPLAVEQLTFKAVLTNEAPVKIVSIMLSTILPICEAVEV